VLLEPLTEAVGEALGVLDETPLHWAWQPSREQSLMRPRRGRRRSSRLWG
jgi:hypothetical protein